MFEIKKLPNNVRIIHEKIPYVRSASIGIFVGVGSRYEKENEGGSAHYIEHMLFKSTTKHSAADLAYIMDGFGGQINAYTTRETTCFYARVLDTHINSAIDVLSEMFFDCKFDETETENERGVILEEIGMYEDTPDDLCYEKLVANSFKGALGRPVLGNKNTLQNMDGKFLRNFKDKNYTAGNIIISLCGNYNQSHLDMICEKFSKLDTSEKKAATKATYTPHFTATKKQLEQNQLAIAFPSNGVASEERFGMILLNTILGGSVSSRLFQNIREKHGLCYSVFSFQSVFRDMGLISIATGVSEDTQLKTLSLISDELKRLKDDGVSEEELRRAKEQAKSSIVMALESTNARMIKLGNSINSIGTCLTTEELLDKYEAVTRDDILNLARDRFNMKNVSLSALGKVTSVEDYQNALKI